MEYSITKPQARRFLLRLHGLLGEHVFEGRQGVVDFTRQAGCIQFDPIDVCGKNAELTLQSRVGGFTKDMLYELLYTDRRLIDYFDKNLAITALEDWPYFERRRRRHRAGARSAAEVAAVSEQIERRIGQNGPVCSKDLGLGEKVNWYWSATTLARAALESMYFCGRLVISHKKGTIKYYDLARKYIPSELLEAPDPFECDEDYFEWNVKRRIGAVGMLQSRASDAFLCVEGLKTGERKAAFEALLERGEIAKILVEGEREPYYCLARDAELLERIAAGESFAPRCELIAPLDSLMWDRRLIRAIFGFEYKWEIYTPAHERKYGYYVLPVLHGEQFIGRIEAVRNAKSGVLAVRGFWPEEGVKITGARKKALESCVGRFANWNGCKDIAWENGARL